uniref:Uncharacterized protein n=1 Tax=Melanopsichium pennsylvanicum 4 TaxID=1398559 RepID=A0A077QZ95_9BASI|nr:uncharacterized protein BN887_06032 [Melanopsichium pennsylvanicum 4]
MTAISLDNGPAKVDTTRTDLKLHVSLRRKPKGGHNAQEEVGRDQQLDASEAEVDRRDTVKVDEAPPMLSLAATEPLSSFQLETEIEITSLISSVIMAPTAPGYLVNGTGAE